jgi:hypothetical protein
MLADLFLGFMVGSIFTLMLISGYVYIKANQLIKKAKAASNDLKDKLLNNSELYEKVKDRLKRLSDITQRELEIMGSMSYPSANATHSRHKNSLVSEAKALQEEKIAIMRSMVAEGLDLEMSVIDESGQSKKMKLSEFLGEQPVDKTQQADKSSNKPKFTVLTGGKSDTDH